MVSKHHRPHVVTSLYVDKILLDALEVRSKRLNINRSKLARAVYRAGWDSLSGYSDSELLDTCKE